MTGPLIIYVHDLRISGVVGNALAIARRVGREREVILAAGAAGAGLPDVAPARLAVLNAPVSGPAGKYAAIMPLRRLIRQSGATVVMSAGNLGDRAVLWATCGLDVRTVYRISNAIGRPKAGMTSWLRERRHRALIRSASRLILVGQSFGEHPDYRRALETGQAVAIPNGVDVAAARKKAKEPSPHPWLDSGDPVVLGIGRIHPQKNFEALIDASALSNAAQPHRLIILGGGPDEACRALQARAEEAGIADRFLLAGQQSNVFAWLRGAALFALVSKWEGSSNALLEAMAVRTPVLASRQAGDARWVLDDDRYGLLVDGNDPADIARGIARQLANPITPGGRAEDFRIADTLDRYAEVLREL